jgi:hypothetical protein
METEDSLSCSQQPAIGPLDKPEQSNPHFKNLFSKNHFNIILPYASTSP